MIGCTCLGRLCPKLARYEFFELLGNGIFHLFFYAFLVNLWPTQVYITYNLILQYMLKILRSYKLCCSGVPSVNWFHMLQLITETPRSTPSATSFQ